MTRRLRQLTAGGLFCLSVVLLLELVLQLGAWLVQGRARHVQAQWLTGHTRILAVGDSNTYGFYLEAQDAWPAQLERQWNRVHPDKPVEVLNLGYPGSNSFRVREALPGLLDTLAPDVVLIMVGFNDFWTPLEMVEPAQQSSVIGWLKAHSRIYRLYAIGTRSHITQRDLAFGASRDPNAPIDVNNPEQHLVRMEDAAFYLGTKQGEPARNRNALEGNLAAMIAASLARDAEVILLTYPSNWGFYPGANKWIKTAAEQYDVPLADITPLFIARCVDGPPSCSELLFHDGHATAQGNALVAESVLQRLSEKH